MFDRLMNKLGVKGKILTLLVMFIVPLTTLGILILQHLNEEHAFAKGELEGLREIKSVFSDALRIGTFESINIAKNKIAQIGHDSGLVLDPKYESFYLQGLLTSDIVEVAEHTIEGALAATTAISQENQIILKDQIVPKFFDNIQFAKEYNEKVGTLDRKLVPVLVELLSRREATAELFVDAASNKSQMLRQALNSLESLSQTINTSLDSIISSRIDQVSYKRNIAWSVTGLTLVFLLILSWIIVKNITNRLQRLTVASLKAAQDGDLNQTIEDQGSDELFELSHSFNAMIASLRGMVQKVVHSGSLIGTSASEIAAVSKQQQATSSEIAATTTQIEATSKQISATAEDLSASMQEVQQIASGTADLASDGQSSLEQMRRTMHSITEACSSISQKLEILNTRASKIGDVVTTIAKVADQTNLLSLNAAIEAEKAGEYGHGFAVVAREIRRLADQTAASTIDIDQMVKEIQGAVAAGVMGMEKFANQVRSGAGEVESTSIQFATIIDQIKTLSPTFQTVAEGMQSQSLGAKQITESLSQLSMAARQTADSLTQSNISIDQLHQATVMLEHEVQRFQIGSAR